MTRTVKNRLWWLSLGLLIGLMPYIYHLADSARYSPGAGSEAFILPALVVAYFCKKYW